MSKKRILFITQEMDPYLDLDGIGSLIQKLPATAQDEGMEIRILMPRSMNEDIDYTKLLDFRE